MKRVAIFKEFLLMFGLHLLAHWVVEVVVHLLLPGFPLIQEIVPVAAATAVAVVLHRHISKH